jgi:hypothetical protein
MSTNNLPDVSVIEKSTLRGIGNAIREKTKGTSEIPVPDMAAVIRSIKSEAKLQFKDVSVTFGATVWVSPDEGYDGLSAVSVVSDPPKLQDITVQSTDKEQVFHANSPEYDGIGIVTVLPVTGGGGVEYPNVMEVSF